MKVSLGWDNDPIMISPCSALAHWKFSKDLICTDRRTVTLVVRVVDDRLNNALLGHLSIPLSDVITSCAEQWWPLSGSARAKLRMSVHWGSLDLGRHAIAETKGQLLSNGRLGEIS